MAKQTQAAEDYVSLGGKFWKSKTSVTFGDCRIKLNPDTVRVFYGHWATDGETVYHEGNHRRSIDAATFTALNGIYAKDAAKCYCEDTGLKYSGLKTLTEADVASFVVLDSGEEHIGILGMLLAGYARDNSHVFYMGSVVKPADPRTFVSLGNCYGRDDKAVFYRGFRLDGAVPSRWRSLGGVYSRDDENVYCEHRILRGVNPDKFERVEPYSSDIGCDGKQFFDRARPFPVADYVFLLRQHASQMQDLANDIERRKWQNRSTRAGGPDPETSDLFNSVQVGQSVQEVEEKFGPGEPVGGETWRERFDEDDVSYPTWEEFIEGKDPAECQVRMWSRRGWALMCLIEAGKVSKVFWG